MLVTVWQYTEIFESLADFSRQLGAAEVLRDASGRPIRFVGNKSVVFKVRWGGRICAVKCYTVSRPNLRRIYGGQCLADELFIADDCRRGGFADVVVTDWIEGRTLRSAIAESGGDAGILSSLSREFDRFALALLDAGWTHGDLKPDNIIVDARGRMHAIDFDAVYRPDLADLENDEAGTAAFQHPLRTAAFYNEHMDDYPIALISSALHALAADPSLFGRCETDEILLFDPRAIRRGESPLLDWTLELFARRCMGVEYRIASLLRSPLPALCGLRELLAWMTGDRMEAGGEVPELCECDGLWGYAVRGSFSIPPVFDDGFEFREGLAAVRLGGWFHFLSPDGRAELTFGDCEAVKPFCNGRAVVIGRNGRFEVGKNGEIFYPPPADSAEN